MKRTFAILSILVGALSFASADGITVIVNNNNNGTVVNNTGNTGPVVNNVDNSGPVVNNVADSGPVVNNNANTGTTVNNTGNAGPTINNADNSGPSESNVLDEARKRAADQQVAPVAEAPADSGGTFLQAPAAQAPAVSDAEVPHPYVPFAVTFVPGIPPTGNYDTSFAAGVIMNDIHSVYGFQGSSIMNIASGDVYGFQGAGIMNLIAGNLTGFQGSGVTNVVNGKVIGAQWAGIINTANQGFMGAQGAGIINIAGGSNSSFFQGAGIININRGNFFGLQAAGIANVADKVTGVQAAGIINIAGTVYGAQVGLVNIADNLYGIPFGFINIIKHGTHDLTFWYDDSKFAYGAWQYGSNNFYTIAYLGEKASDLFRNQDSLTGGIGFGTRSKFGHLTVDVDASAKTFLPTTISQLSAINQFVQDKATNDPVMTKADADYVQSIVNQIDVFPSFRALVSLPIGPFAIFGGITLDTAIEGVVGVPVQYTTTKNPLSFDLFDYKIDMYPKFFFGIRL